MHSSCLSQNVRPDGDSTTDCLGLGRSTRSSKPTIATFRVAPGRNRKSSPEAPRFLLELDQYFCPSGTDLSLLATLASNDCFLAMRAAAYSVCSWPNFAGRGLPRSAVESRLLPISSPSPPPDAPRHLRRAARRSVYRRLLRPPAATTVRRPPFP